VASQGLIEDFLVAHARACRVMRARHIFSPSRDSGTGNAVARSIALYCLLVFQCARRIIIASAANDRGEFAAAGPGHEAFSTLTSLVHLADIRRIDVVPIFAQLA
jgi:hypothetical protein